MGVCLRARAHASVRVHACLRVCMLICVFVCVRACALVGVPMACWTPATFPDGCLEHVKQYCWVKNIYYIPMDDSIPVEVVRRESEEVTYYQWVPFILLFMACLFKLPCVLWRGFNQASGISIDKFREMTSLCPSFPRLRGGRACRTWRSTSTAGSGLTKESAQEDPCPYSVWQTSVCVRAEAGHVLPHSALRVCQTAVLRKLFVDAEWTVSARFPPVTLCDLDIRQLENVQRFTVQCALPINIYNEKVFAFLWFWLAWLALVTSASFLLWVWRIFCRQDYVEKYLDMQGRLKGGEDRRQGEVFVDVYLRDDGIFLSVSWPATSTSSSCPWSLHNGNIYLKQIIFFF
ncbi:hypothetical protein ACOMHN_049597 [Nucella lapillus]